MPYKILHLNVIEHWFDLIICPKRLKTVEYRMIKPHWQSRLLEKAFDKRGKPIIDPKTNLQAYGKQKKIEYIAFRNGDAKNTPKFFFEYDGFEILNDGIHLTKPYHLDMDGPLFAIKIGEPALQKLCRSCDTRLLSPVGLRSRALRKWKDDVRYCNECQKKCEAGERQYDIWRPTT
jgi:hypothetical protein